MININLTKNKLAKHNLGLVIIVGFAFMGIIACPSGGGGGGSTPTPTPTTNGGGTTECTEDTDLDNVPAFTINTVVATGPSDAGGVTLTWTEPTADGFTGVEISGGTPALASPMMVAAGTQTASISGLTVGEVSNFTVKSMYGTQCSTGERKSVTPQGAIALFSLGEQNGNFGFDACQTAIDNVANTNLRSRGYTQARFFGSTPTYSYIAIHTDTDALGVSGATIGDYTIAAFTDSDLTATTAPATTFGAPNAATRTLSNILTLSGNNWSAEDRAVVETVSGALTNMNPMWTFTNNSGASAGGYSSSFNCSGATSASISDAGATANHATIGTSGGCDQEHLVLCVAR